MEGTGLLMKWELWDLSHQTTVRAVLPPPRWPWRIHAVHYLLPGNQVCVCIQRCLQSLSDFPDGTSQPVCIHSCLLLSSENKNPFFLNVLRFGHRGQNYERFSLKSSFPMQQDRNNTARQSIWASELCWYFQVQSIRSSDPQAWLKSCSRQHDIAPSHIKCDELLIDVLKGELKLASQNSPQEYRICLQLEH